jgi:hypothetical protein
MMVRVQREYQPLFTSVVEVFGVRAYHLRKRLRERTRVSFSGVVHLVIWSSGYLVIVAQLLDVQIDQR